MRPSAAESASASVPHGRPSAPAPIAVLRAWDRRRAAAYATGDPDALRRLYVPGSRAGRRDVALLRGYLERGIRVRGMRMQLLRVRVLDRARRRLVLAVSDRLVGAVAVGASGATPLPRDRVSVRVVQLRRHGHRWRVATVRTGTRLR